MNLYIYSDESGVFDNVHNKYFVFGGIIFLDKTIRDNINNKYISIEKMIKKEILKNNTIEAKASILKNNEKRKLYQSLSKQYKFGVIIREDKILQNIFNDKKSKQRYLDYAYKIAFKKELMNLERNKIIKYDNIDNIYINVDEHTTATDGRYELKEALYYELKIGTFNYNYQAHYPAIIPNLKTLELKYVDSRTKALIRASDIIANKIFHNALNDAEINNTIYMHTILLP